jgi:hypothetical protein
MERCGLEYECDFVYPEDIIAGRLPQERAAVKYSVSRDKWLVGRV